MNIETRDHFFMKLAATVAQQSKDPSSQIGVCIAREDRVISLGYNGICQGVLDPNDKSFEQVALWDQGRSVEIAKRNERPEKYFWWEHAERNAIYSAARLGVSTEGATMYCACNVPCCDCARAIIQSGIKMVVYLPVDNSEKWEEQSKRARQMFREAGVRINAYKGKPFGISIRRNENIIKI